ncbi:MAG: CDP-alcohol phosphatidyltransferase family protein [Kofleriaceae bacterium]
MSVPGPKRPLISANMVTEARLVTMPLIAWLVYRGFATGEHGYLWFALAFGTLIGCTDFVDGYLARKHGPTVFGGLLDPIADKVFVALAYMPFADDVIGLVPAWVCALMFVREFLVTALRSAYEQRSLSLKTSYLAKAKTWTQMQGIGMLVLFPLIGRDRPMTIIFWVGILGPLVAAGALFAVKRKLWRGAFWMSGAFVALLAIHLHDPTWTMRAMMGMIVGITWLSGVDYVVAGFTQLRGRGDFNRSDAVRLLGSVALPVTAFAALTQCPAPAWALITLVSIELAVGGLDNLLSHHHQAAGAVAWGLRTLGASALLVAAVLVPSQAELLAIAAMAVSIIGVGREFWRGRDYYLDKRIRRRALDDAAATA